MFYIKTSICEFVVQLLSCIQLFAIPWTTACQASLSLTLSWSLLKFMSIEIVKLFNYLILCHPLLFFCLQAFPALTSFTVSQLFTSCVQEVEVSDLALVLPLNIKSWFPLGLISLISMQSKGLLRVFSA